MSGVIGSDKSEIDALVKAFFNIFNNKEGKQLNLDSIREMCIPEIVTIKKTGLTQTVYSLESFIEPRVKLLSDGTLKEFEEWETEEQTNIFGNIGQRQSKYQKSGYLNGSHFSDAGVKLFQFIKTERGWKISSLVWEDDEKLPSTRR